MHTIRLKARQLCNKIYTCVYSESTSGVLYQQKWVGGDTVFYLAAPKIIYYDSYQKTTTLIYCKQKSPAA